MSRVTLKMIAEKAGTSIGTVDRVLNHRGGVSERSRRKVTQVAEALGYRTNLVASALGRKRAVRLGVVCPDEPREFYALVHQGIDEAARALQDYGVVVEKIPFGRPDPQLMSACMEQVDSARYDGLAVNLSGAGNIAHINRMVQAGVPVITFNTDLPDSARLFYIGNDAYRSGLVGGELLSLLLGGRGNVTVLGNFARATPFLDRFGGFCEYVQLHAPNLRIYPCAECFSDPDIASESLMDLLKREPDINGVFCTGYSSTVGTVRALAVLGRADVKVVGYDVTDRTAEDLRTGRCHALLFQDPYRQGHQAVHLLARHLLEGWSPPSPRLHVDTQIVLKSNVDSYLNPPALRPQIQF